MSEQPQEPFKESNLESPEYRERLMRKLNTLIAVLEVASAKVDRSINAPAADIDRLAKIRTNLSSTLEVCRSSSSVETSAAGLASSRAASSTKVR